MKLRQVSGSSRNISDIFPKQKKSDIFQFDCQKYVLFNYPPEWIMLAFTDLTPPPSEWYHLSVPLEAVTTAYIYKRSHENASERLITSPTCSLENNSSVIVLTRYVLTNGWFSLALRLNWKGFKEAWGGKTSQCFTRNRSGFFPVPWIILRSFRFMSNLFRVSWQYFNEERNY